ILMELVELSIKSLAKAMFEKLGLPKPVYFKVYVDYNYYQQEQQKSIMQVTYMLLEKAGEIKQHKKTIKQITRDACDYVE
ncbi:hypothetical protein ZWY2020_043496, partial [Hordeum vulgare]